MAEEKKKEKKSTKPAGAKKPKAEQAPKGGKEAKQAAPKERKPLVPRKPLPFEQNYLDEVVPALQKEFKYKNKMQIPRLTKIVVNTCLKEALQDRKILETAAEEIQMITGQRPVLTRSKKSIANFKLRKGSLLGARVTLRGGRMYEFMNRLVSIALPRVRDFKGVSNKSFDGQGNYTLGLTEQIIFPEIDYDKVTKVNGMNVTFVTTAKTDEEGRQLLSLMGMPFRKA